MLIDMKVDNEKAWQWMLLFIIVAAMLIQSCDASNSPVSATNPDASFLSTQAFTFTASVDPTTLTKDQGISYFGRHSPSMQNRYIISNPDELNSFNQTFGLNVLLSDLDSYTYFFFLGPFCPEYFEYAGNSYDNGIMTIVMNHFRVSNVACMASLNEFYYVYKAHKK